MKGFILLVLAVFAAVGTVESCTCKTMKWAICDGPPCTCTLTFDDIAPQPINCETLVPKCFLMKTEMYRARNKLSVRGSIGGKPVETAFVDNDGIYDPDCEADGKFKAKQCNNTEECWCVNSAGVRRTDKGDKNIKCEELVETYWIRLELKHTAAASNVDRTSLKEGLGKLLEKRYGYNKTLIHNVEYDPEGRFIVADLKKEMGKVGPNLGNMAYYMEKDLKVLPLFTSQEKVSVEAGTQNLEMEKILVYYVDEKAPTFTMQHLSGGIIAVIVVVVLAVVIGILLLFFFNRRRKQQQQYSKTQQREMDNM